MSLKLRLDQRQLVQMFVIGEFSVGVLRHDGVDRVVAAGGKSSPAERFAGQSFDHR